MNPLVGLYSPLPPAHTGVADYSAALLAELRTRGRVEIAPERCDVALYHIGNNALHAAIYHRALQHPGVVVLHDAVLQHFLLGQLGETAYVDEFVYNYGEWNRGLALDLWRRRAGSGSDDRYFRYPMLRRIAERSTAIVVHNPAAAQVVREHAPGARIVEIPHLFAPPELPDLTATLRYRQQLGIEPGTFLFGLFGYLRESKRVIAILDAFREAHRQAPAHRPAGGRRVRIERLGPRRRTHAPRAGRGAPSLSSGARVLAGRQCGGRLHQSALSHRR